MFKGDAFRGVNTKLNGHLKDMKRKGLVKAPEHKEAMQDADFKVLMN